MRFACSLIVLLTMMNIALAQTANTKSASTNLSILDQVVPIGTEYQNSIKLLNNRFRVDSDVSEVTLIFFRAFGSAPIVLVRPDGSKVYLENDSGDDSFNWFETDTYDMISLKNPMPGPWQAVGNILPGSRVMIIADITLEASPIPDIVFSGETLKQTAFLKNAGSRVDMSTFRDVVALSIDFVSTNNPNFPNFGLGSRSVARFEDNGLGFDEKESDGTFTGQFNLQITEGEWRPIFTVRTPLFSREQVNDKVVLLPNPVIVSVEPEYNEDKDHLLSIDVDRDYVKIESLLLDGTIRHPSGEIVRFSYTEVSNDARLVNILNTDYGIYKVNMNVFGVSTSGRDIVLTVPEFSFVTEPPPIVIEPLEEIAEVTELEPIELALPEEESSPVLMVIFINLGLLITGGTVMFILVDKRNNPDDYWLKRMLNKLKNIKRPKFLQKKDKTSEKDSELADAST